MKSIFTVNMSQHIKIDIPNSSKLIGSSHFQPIIISWTNPNTDLQDFGENHIKKEKELQIIQTVPILDSLSLENEGSELGELEDRSGRLVVMENLSSIQYDVKHINKVESQTIGRQTLRKLPKNHRKLPKKSQKLEKSANNSQDQNKNPPKSTKASRNQTNSSSSNNSSHKIPQIKSESEIRTTKFTNLELPARKKEESNNYETTPAHYRLTMPEYSALTSSSIKESARHMNSDDDDDDDELGLVIKEEEEEIHIVDVIEQSNSELTFADISSKSWSSNSTKRSEKITTHENPPKKLKIAESVPIIPYIPPAKISTLRKSSTSSSDSITSSNQFQCKICQNIFKRKIDMIHHMKSHAEAKYQCQRCGMKFKFEGYFLKHECIACDICGDTFVLQQQLRNHQRNVHGKKFDMLECDLCGKKMRNRYGMLYHMSKIHMQLLEDGFRCDICGKGFKLKESIRLHMKNHEAVVECRLCSRKVKKVNMNVHMKLVHATERNFQCKYCKLSFKTKECLRSHTRTHEKNFKCTECGKKFANNSHLKEHIEWHKNPDALKCKICDKAFSQKYCLKAHVKLHESGHIFTKFKCSICAYSTDNADNYKKHEMKHKRQEENKELKKDWLKCEKCSLKVKNKLKLATHYWKKHNEVMP